MSLTEIEEVVKSLSREELAKLAAYVEDYLEEQLQLTDQFAASIELGNKDIAEGNVRVRNPEQA